MKTNAVQISKKTDLKTLAQFFISNGGCGNISCDAECPLSNNFNCCTLVMSNNIPIHSITKKWAVEYLEQIKKLEFLDNL